MEIMVLTETKIDESFCKQEFYIQRDIHHSEEIEIEYSFMPEKASLAEK